MNTPIGAAFGGLLAFILLAMYSVLTIYMVREVIDFCAPGVECVAPTKSLFGEGMTYVVTTAGGLVSAFVIAQLSVTPPGGVPMVGNFAPTSNTGKTVVSGIAALYLFVWLGTGLSALIVGVVFYQGISSTVSDIGTTWLGLAVSASYAYLGIEGRRLPNDGAGGTT